MAEKIKIGNSTIGAGHPVFIIAEISANHRGKISNAFNLIDAAKEAGADAAKFQLLTHDKIAADAPIFIGKKETTLSKFYKSAEMPYEWVPELIAHAREKEIIFLATPFDKDAVDILDQAGVPAFKVASYELTDDILLTYIAKKGRPIILSTGMADIKEVEHAIKVIQKTGNDQIILLHCTSIYPPKFEDLNLRAIKTMADAFKLPVGYSDHTQPPFVSAAVVAVTLGACVIEKHITENQDGGSNDDANSINIDEFKRYVVEIRNAEKALSGKGLKQPVSHRGHKDDEISERWARRSVYAACELNSGDIITDENIITLRPTGGIEPKDFHLFRGKVLKHPVKAREPLKPEYFS